MAEERMKTDNFFVLLFKYQYLLNRLQLNVFCLVGARTKIILRFSVVWVVYADKKTLMSCKCLLWLKHYIFAFHCVVW